MKKTLLLLIVLLFCVVFLFGCNPYASLLEELEEYEHDVTLNLVSSNSTDSFVLTSRLENDVILCPDEYKIMDSYLKKYVVLDDTYYLDKNFTQVAYFPLTMSNKPLKLYAKVSILTPISSVHFAAARDVRRYFASQTTLKDEYGLTPNESLESSYYEIKVRNIGVIDNILQYYPAKQEIVLLRGYSITDTWDLGAFQDEYTAGISINLKNKTVKFVGIYTRGSILGTGYSGGGVVSITFDINQLSIDKIKKPLVPSYEGINYTYKITSASNYAKMKELWEEEGHNYAKKCYSQFNTLMETISQKVVIFS